MPPKPKFSREDVIDAAYALAKTEGIDSVVIRAIAKELGSTTSPIFTLFSGIDEIHSAVFERAQNEFIEYLGECRFYEPAFKEFGMRWIRYAKKNPNLYRLIFSGEAVRVQGGNDLMARLADPSMTVIEGIRKNFDLSEPQARELMNQMVIHGNGIAAFLISGYGTMTEEQIGRSLSETCIGLMMAIRAREGVPVMIPTEKLKAAIELIPQRIEDGTASKMEI